MIEKPATSSFVSANGPSMTVRLSPLNFTRAPFEVGASPSAARRIPAFASSALLHCGKLFGLGQIALFRFLRRHDHDHETHSSLLNSVRVGCRALRGLTNTSKETGQNRHALRESRKLSS